MAHLWNESETCLNQNILSGFFFEESEGKKEEADEHIYILVLQACDKLLILHVI